MRRPARPAYYAGNVNPFAYTAIRDSLAPKYSPSL